MCKVPAFHSKTRMSQSQLFFFVMPKQPAYLLVFFFFFFWSCIAFGEIILIKMHRKKTVLFMWTCQPRNGQRKRLHNPKPTTACAAKWPQTVFYLLFFLVRNRISRFFHISLFIWCQILSLGYLYWVLHILIAN